MEEARGHGKADWVGHCITYCWVTGTDTWQKQLVGRETLCALISEGFSAIHSHKGMAENLIWWQGLEAECHLFTWQLKTQRTSQDLSCDLQSPPIDTFLLLPASFSPVRSHWLPNTASNWETCLTSFPLKSECMPPRSLYTWIGCASKTSTTQTEPRLAAILSSLVVLDHNESSLWMPVWQNLEKCLPRPLWSSMHGAPMVFSSNKLTNKQTKAFKWVCSFML